MNRKELVAKAKEMGFEGNPNKEKSVVLEAFIASASKPKGIKTGRKIDPTSARQKRLAELEAKREAGELKRGRPVNEESARQKRIAELEAKREAGELKRGRAIDPTSARQKRIAELEAKKIANGGVIPRGREKKVIETAPVEVDA